MRTTRIAVQVALVGLLGAAALAGCARDKQVDWSAPENFYYHEESSNVDGGVQLTYWALVDAPPDAVYRALADVEHYAQFVDGVDRTQLLAQSENTKTILIAQRVIGRQNNAQVLWTFHPEQRRIQFDTQQSDLYENEGEYEIVASPNGMRSLVKVTFVVKESAHVSIPRGVLESTTRDTFGAAARSIKKRAVELASGQR